MIVERIDTYKASKIKQRPVLSNRASSLGHPCLRFNVFERTRWQEKTLHDVAVQYRFDDGDMHERQVMRDLEDAGFQVFERHRDFSWPKFNITAHVDVKLVVEPWMVDAAPPEVQPLLQIGHAIPAEVKSAAKFSWEKIQTVQDMRTSRYAYMQTYPAQLTVYELFSNEPIGLFLFKNKDTGRLKELWMPLDFEYGESLLKKAEQINTCVQAGTIPAPIPWSDTICGRCAYQHICLPEARREALDLSDDPELEAKLKRRAELAQAATEYDELDKELKATFREKPKIMVGDFLVQGRWQDRKDGKKVWMTNIERLTPTKGVSDG